MPRDSRQVTVPRPRAVLLNIGKCLTLRFLLHRGRFHGSPGTDVSAFLVWGSRCQAKFQQRSSFFLSSFLPSFLSFCSAPAEPILSSRPTRLSWPPRAQGPVKDGRRPSRSPRHIISRPLLDRPEHGRQARARRDQRRCNPLRHSPAASKARRSRRACPGVGAEIARHNLVFGRSQRI